MSDGRIQNGDGDKRYMAVDAQHRAQVFSTTISEGDYVNEENHESYIMFTNITPTGANDWFWWMKNTHATDVMVLDWYRVWTASSAEAIDLHFNPIGTPTNTTALTPVNSTVGNENTAAVELYESVDMGGLSGGTQYDRLRINGDGKDVVDRFPSKIVIPKSGIVGCTALNGAIPIELTFSFHYKHQE